MVNLVLLISVCLLQLALQCVCLCIPPATIPHGKVSLGRGGFIVSYSCNAQYTLEGTAVAVCVGGKWSTPRPHCVLEDTEGDLYANLGKSSGRGNGSRRANKKKKKTRDRQRSSERKESDSAVPLEEQQQRDQHVITAYNIVESPSTVKDILKGRRQKGEMRKNSGESSSSSSFTIITTTTSVDPSTDSKPEEPLRNHRRQERRRGRKDRRRGRKKDRKGRRGERRKGRKERRGRKKKIEGQMTESAAEMDRSVNEVSTGGDGGSRSPTTPQITSSDVGSGSEARRRENKRKKKKVPTATLR